MKKKRDISNAEWNKHWIAKEAMGMSNTNFDLCSHDEYVSDYECDLALNQRSSKLNGMIRIKLGRQGRKCNR